MPDYEYRQRPSPCACRRPRGWRRIPAVGRIPLAQGWKAVYGASEPDAASDETEQTLPPLTRDAEFADLAVPLFHRPLEHGVWSALLS
jgi:hypothetical protein